MKAMKAGRGAAVIEFIIGLPIFLTIVYGAFELGRIYGTEYTMAFAIEEAARFSVVNPSASSAQIATVVQDNAVGLDGSLIMGRISFEQDNSGAGTAPRAFVKISGSHDYRPIIPLVLPVVGVGGIDFTALQLDIVTSTRMAFVIP